MKQNQQKSFYTTLSSVAFAVFLSVLLALPLVIHAEGNDRPWYRRAYCNTLAFFGGACKGENDLSVSQAVSNLEEGRDSESIPLQDSPDQKAPAIEPLAFTAVNTELYPALVRASRSVVQETAEENEILEENIIRLVKRVEDFEDTLTGVLTVSNDIAELQRKLVENPGRSGAYVTQELFFAQIDSIYDDMGSSGSDFLLSDIDGTSRTLADLDLTGTLSVTGSSAPAVSAAGEGVIYFDAASNTFKVSENGGAYQNLLSAGTTTYLGLTDTPGAFTANAIPYTNAGGTALLHSSDLTFDGTMLVASAISSPGGGIESEAFGDRATTSGNAATAVGVLSSVGIGGTAVGHGSGDGCSFCVSIGYSSSAIDNGVSVGPLSSSAAGSVAIGRNAAADEENTFVSGDPSHEIAHVYFGQGISSFTPAGYTIHGTRGLGTDVIGGTINIAGGQSTGAGAGGSIVFQTSPAGATGTTLNALVDRMTITHEGFIGIGQPNPTAQLEIVGGGKFGLALSVKGGSMRLDTGQGIEFQNFDWKIGKDLQARSGLITGGALQIQVDTGVGDGLQVINASGASWFEILGSDGTARFAGNVGIGTAGAPSYPLHVSIGTDGDVAGFTDTNGTCTINPTSTSLVCSSDDRLKVNELPIDGALALDAISKLNPVSFLWKGQDGDTPHFGLIAQEVEEVDTFRSLVSTRSTGYKAVSYGSFTPFMLSAIKELNLKVSLLESGGTEENSDSIFQHIADWFKDKIFRAREVHIEKLCIGETCVTESELKELLEESNVDEDESEPTPDQDENDSESDSNSELEEENTEVEIVDETEDETETPPAEDTEELKENELVEKAPLPEEDLIKEESQQDEGQQEDSSEQPLDTDEENTADQENENIVSEDNTETEEEA